MACIRWNENLSVGIAQMDQQHKKLVDMVNRLYDAMNQGKGNETAASILGELVNYTKIHFAAEEQLMQKHHFPNFIAHKKIHDELTNKAVDLNQKIKNGEMVMAVSLSIFLKDWLQNHIMKEDKQYGNHIIHQPAAVF